MLRCAAHRLGAFGASQPISSFKSSFRPSTCVKVAKLCTRSPQPPPPPPKAQPSSNAFWAAIAAYERALEARPLFTKSITSGVLYGAGDLIAQVCLRTERTELTNLLDSAGQACGCVCSTRHSARLVCCPGGLKSATSAGRQGVVRSCPLVSCCSLRRSILSRHRPLPLQLLGVSDASLPRGLPMPGSTNLHGWGSMDRPGCP
eukprot:scaffold282606_cov37-Tisochrysis_lutea.AAC.2